MINHRTVIRALLLIASAQAVFAQAAKSPPPPSWRPVYVLFLIVGAVHVISFSTTAPFIALINLVLEVLVASTKSYFFVAR